jgi:hypothetical protein
VQYPENNGAAFDQNKGYGDVALRVLIQAFANAGIKMIDSTKMTLFEGLGMTAPVCSSSP